jgi:hypothetical protein
VLKKPNIFYFEKSKSVIQYPGFTDFEKLKFQNASNFKVFQSESFVMQKLVLANEELEPMLKRNFTPSLGISYLGV